MDKVVKYLLIFLLFANICQVVQPQTVTREQLLKLFYQANVAKNNDQIGDAIEAYKQIISLSPKLPDTYLQLGDVYAMSANDVTALQNACGCFQKYLDLSPEASNAKEIKDKISSLKETIELLEIKETPTVLVVSFPEVKLGPIPPLDSIDIKQPVLVDVVPKDSVHVASHSTIVLNDSLIGRWVSASLGQNGREEWILDLKEDNGSWLFELNDSSYITKKNHLFNKMDQNVGVVHSVDSLLHFGFVVKEKKKVREGFMDKWDVMMNTLFGNSHVSLHAEAINRASKDSIPVDSVMKVEPFIEHSYSFDLSYDGFKFVGSVLYKSLEHDGVQAKILHQTENKCEFFKAPDDYRGFTYVPLVTQQEKTTKAEFRNLLNSKLSESGTSVSAVNDLGCMYAAGLGIRSNMKMAVAYFMEASMKKNLFAMLNMAQLYQDGIGVDKDVEKARDLYIQAYEQGYTDAMVMCGDTYLISAAEGKPDYKKAFDCYLKAVYKRCPYAFYRLGWLYSEGLGVEKNVEKAWEYYQRALDMLYPDAMTDVGIFYRYGEMGVNLDYVKSLEWLTKAADKGNSKAMYELYDMYLRGDGVAPDFKYAKTWYLKALRADDKVVDGYNSMKSQIKAILSTKEK